MNALRDMGIDVDNCRRVVIDISADYVVPMVHVELFGSEKTIDVIQTLAGIVIETKEV